MHIPCESYRASPAWCVYSASIPGAVKASEGGATGGQKKVRGVWILTRCQGFGKLMRKRGVYSPFLNGATSVFRFLVWNDTLWLYPARTGG